jgi:hypothetical protein
MVDGGLKRSNGGSIACVCAAMVVALAARQAAAQPDAAQKALATRLFDEGRALAAAGRTAEACAKLEESQRLDPAPGTLLNLAVCHEALGKTATAWAEFCDARVAAQRDGRGDRVALADQRARALEKKLSRLTIAVAPEAALPGLVVRRDGVVFSRDGWGVALPVDPGEHAIEAAAPGHVAWRARAHIGAEADAQTIQVSLLEREPPPPRLELAPTVPVAARVAPSAGRDARARRLPVLSLAATGVAAAAVGSYFGVTAIRDRSASTNQCPLGHCTHEGVELNDHAKTAADVSTVAFSLAVVSVAAASYLFLSAPRPNRDGAPGPAAAGGMTIGAVVTPLAGGGVAAIAASY